MSDRNPDGSPDLNQLRTFLAVHRTGSFTAAAALLGLSQPTVTAQIRALEGRLGLRLFDRLARGAAPTPAADELAADVAGPLDALAAATGGTGEPGPVRLAGPAEMLSVLVLPALAPLAGHGLRLRVTTGLADDLLAGLRQGRFDLVVSTTRPRGRVVAADPLMDEEFVLVAAPTWAARTGPGLPAALRDVPLVGYAADLPIVRRYWRHVFGARLTRPAAVTVPDLRAVRAAVAAGAGFSVLPRYLCAGELASGALVPLLEPDDPPINTAFLAQRTGTVEPHVAAVRDRIREAARSW
ncbi:MAG TPA: LysR family transcriptional regulator [Spirillospora sp.]|nr:LysR family transcriptional regulator [Spirillospora sp.]